MFDEVGLLFHSIPSSTHQHIIIIKTSKMKGPRLALPGPFLLVVIVVSAVVVLGALGKEEHVADAGQNDDNFDDEDDLSASSRFRPSLMTQVSLLFSNALF